MATLAHTYTDGLEIDVTLDRRERTGGPRGPRRSATKRVDFYERFVSSAASGSHMPLDTEMHWSWDNPLNVIPAMALLLVIVALVALVVG